MTLSIGSSRVHGRLGLFLTVSLSLALAFSLLAYRGWSQWHSERLRQAAIEAEQRGRWEDAERSLARLPTLTPADWLRRAQVAANRKKFEAAISFLDHVPTNGALALPSSLLRGQIELRRFHARAAEIALRHALALDPTSTAARRLLVYLYGIQERQTELRSQFEAMAEQGPLTLDIVFHWSLSHFALGEPEKVRADQEAFVAHDPDDHPVAARTGAHLPHAEGVRSDRGGAKAPVRLRSRGSSRSRQLAIDRGETSKAAELLAGTTFESASHVAAPRPPGPEPA